MPPPSVTFEYPRSLPCPSSAGMAWAERRELSDLPGPEQRRPIFTDRLGTQDLFIFFRTLAQVEQFKAWYLTARGNWFAAHWPRPDGVTGVYRILGGLQYTGFMPRRKGWGVAFSAQIRGRGELPVTFLSNCSEAIDAAELAGTEVPLIYKYRLSTPVPNPPVGIVGQYELVERLPGGAVGPADYEFHYTPIEWGDLPELSTVGMFFSERNAAEGQHRAYITVTLPDVPPSSIAQCKTIVWQDYGGPPGPTATVTVNAVSLGAADVVADVFEDILTMQIVLRLEAGVLTATKV